MKISICGVKYSINNFNRMVDVCHDSSGRKLWGQISSEKSSINLFRACDERMSITLIHEILHGVIDGLSIRELKDDSGCHNETAIEQLSVGIAEALNSIGFLDIVSKIKE
jgi:hypothetical protein